MCAWCVRVREFLARREYVRGWEGICVRVRARSCGCTCLYAGACTRVRGFGVDVGEGVVVRVEIYVACGTDSVRVGTHRSMWHQPPEQGEILETTQM